MACYTDSFTYFFFTNIEIVLITNKTEFFIYLLNNPKTSCKLNMNTDTNYKTR
jgi:hypothetical protein